MIRTNVPERTLGKEPLAVRPEDEAPSEERHVGQLLGGASFPGCVLSPRQSPSSLSARAYAEDSPAWATFAWSPFQMVCT